MASLSHRKTLALIDKAFAELEFLDDIHMTRKPLRDCFNLALDGEKRHRKFNPGPYHVTISLAARMHVVRWLAHYTKAKNIPSCKEMLDLREDFVMCAMVAANYGVRILAALRKADIDPESLRNLNYVELVEGRDQSAITAEELAA